MDDLVCSIERATLDAVPPAARCEIGPWLVGLDAGPVRRAHSAAPLRHGAQAASLRHRAAIEACFRAHGLPVVYRLPQVPAFDGFRGALAADGYAPSPPVWVLHAAVADVLSSRATSTQVSVDLKLHPHPDDAWSSLFLGEGGDRRDAQARLDQLKRGTAGTFASAVVDRQVVAVGAACFSEGWCGIHAMRTSHVHRNQGLARALLQGLSRQGRARGIERAWLQVEAGNRAALALYRSAGFVGAWAYDYWLGPEASR